MALTLLLAATPAQADRYEQGLQRHIDGMQAPCEDRTKPESERLQFCSALLAYKIALIEYRAYGKADDMDHEEYDPPYPKKQTWRPALR